MKNIEGNFRQGEIRKQWEKYDKKKKYGLVHLKSYTLLDIYYIRQLIHTLGKEIGLLGSMAIDINRIYIHI